MRKLDSSFFAMTHEAVTLELWSVAMNKKELKALRQIVDRATKDDAFKGKLHDNWERVMRGEYKIKSTTTEIQNALSRFFMAQELNDDALARVAGGHGIDTNTSLGTMMIRYALESPEKQVEEIKEAQEAVDTFESVKNSKLGNLISGPLSDVRGAVSDVETTAQSAQTLMKDLSTKKGEKYKDKIEKDLPGAIDGSSKKQMEVAWQLHKLLNQKV
jgi:hypothetical protein